MKIYVNDKYIKSSKINKNYKIVNLTDTHFRGDNFSKDINDAIKMVEKINPDMVSLTGDFIDSLEYGVNYKKDLRVYLEYLSSICPTFMSFGSHDLELFLRHGNRDDFSEERKKYQEEYFAFLKSIDGDFYPILPESTERIDLDDNISVFGYSYPDNEGPNMEKIHGDMGYMQKYFAAMDKDEERYNILLCHGPLAFFDKGKLLSDWGNFDLILSGHNHAGMIPHFLRFLPFGLIDPDRNILPKNMCGLFDNGNGTVMDISPGFLKVPGIVMEDIPVVGNLIYKCNYLYAEEFDVINLNQDVKELKKMG